MAAQFAHADGLREYLTGAASDGAAQTNPSASLGNYRSSTEAASLGIQIANALAGVTVLYAAGANNTGTGTLTCVDANTLVWKPPGALAGGAPANFPNGTTTQIVEGTSLGQYLRITATAPLTPGVSQITLTALYNNQFGMDNVAVADAAAGISQYRASMIRNESTGNILNFQRWIGELGTAQVSNGGGLGGAGSSTITTTGSFADWPGTGYCQIRNAGGTLKEVVYYSSRTATILTVPAAGRGLLGTSATAGSNTDVVHAVPGIAIALDPAGVQASGNSIQTIANQTTAPAGVTWNLGITAAGGLQIGTMAANTEVGIWVWRQVPAGTIAGPGFENLCVDAFQSY